jgi:hypothetical protein
VLSEVRKRPTSIYVSFRKSNTKTMEGKSEEREEGGKRREVERKKGGIENIVCSSTPSVSVL